MVQKDAFNQPAWRHPVPDEFGLTEVPNGLL